MQAPFMEPRAFIGTMASCQGFANWRMVRLTVPAAEKTLKKAFLALPLLLLAGPALGQSDEQYRKSFQDMFAGSCVAEQRKAAPNLKVSDAAIQSYCSCFGGQIPTAITVQEMRQVAATGTLTPELQSRLTALGKSCVDRLKQ
jgi:hypothetical protein